MTLITKSKVECNYYVVLNANPFNISEPTQSTSNDQIVEGQVSTSKGRKRKSSVRRSAEKEKDVNVKITKPLKTPIFVRHWYVIFFL